MIAKVVQHKNHQASVYFDEKHVATCCLKDANYLAQGLQRSTGAEIVNVRHDGMEFNHTQLQLKV